MNEVEEKHYCKEEILVKYSGLFKPYRLDIFNRRVKHLDEAICKKYNGYITIFLYVKDKDNNILHTRKMVYNPSLPEKKEFFFNTFENFRKYYYQFTSKGDMKKLFIAYCIVPHEMDNTTNNYDNFVDINEKFEKIYTINHPTIIYKKIKENLIKFFTYVYTFLSLCFVLFFLNKIDSLPLQTINFNILPFLISKYLIFLLISLGLILFLIYWYFLDNPIKSFLSKICRRKYYITKCILYQDFFDIM